MSLKRSMYCKLFMNGKAVWESEDKQPIATSLMIIMRLIDNPPDGSDNISTFDFRVSTRPIKDINHKISEDDVIHMLEDELNKFTQEENGGEMPSADDTAVPGFPDIMMSEVIEIRQTDPLWDRMARVMTNNDNYTNEERDSIRQQFKIKYGETKFFKFHASKM